jgi:serine/threonine-protein kinase HipA
VVELYDRPVGVLREEPDTFDFVADPQAIAHYGVGSSMLSFAVPLVENPRRGDAAIRRNFFDEILPEGRARTRLAGNARLAPDYTIGMLARYGRDVAGALKIWDPMAPGEPRTPGTESIDDAGIRRLLEDVRDNPLSNHSVRRMSSLAGVQDKIVLARLDGAWAEPFDGFPSTHILKPVVGKYPTLIFDEEYGARIARHLGLATHDTHVEQFAGVSALVIERYDRSPVTPDGRLHQEDFNQVLGTAGDGKYQEHGHPGLRAIARVLRERIGRDAVEQLLRLTTMSLAVGNLDMHAKNIAVLHLPDGSARLAPAYDIVPQTHLPFDPVFAFQINGAYAHDEIGFRDIVAEAASWGVRSAEEIVEAAIVEIQEFVTAEQPVAGAHFALAEDIHRITDRLLVSRDSATSARRVDGPSSRELPTSPGGWGGPGSR